MTAKKSDVTPCNHHLEVVPCSGMFTETSHNRRRLVRTNWRAAAPHAPALAQHVVDPPVDAQWVHKGSEGEAHAVPRAGKWAAGAKTVTRPSEAASLESRRAAMPPVCRHNTSLAFLRPRAAVLPPQSRLSLDAHAHAVGAEGRASVAAVLA